MGHFYGEPTISLLYDLYSQLFEFCSLKACGSFLSLDDRLKLDCGYCPMPIELFMIIELASFIFDAFNIHSSPYSIFWLNKSAIYK